MRASVMWAGALGLAALLSASCGDDGPSAQTSAGEGGSGAGDGSPSAGADEGGTAQGASGGTAPSAGSGAPAQAGAAQAGAPGQAGAPAAGGEGGGPGDAGVIARDQAMPTGIAIDAQNVYWGNSDDGTIVTCPLGGCDGEPRVIVETAGEVRGIAVDATSVYWLITANVGNMAPLRKCPLTGCEGPPVTLGDVSSARPNDVHVIGTVLYYTAWPDFSACTITNCAQAARTSLGMMPVVAVDVAETSIYFSRYGSQIISRCTRPTCSDLVDLVTGHPAMSVAVDATTLYFSELGFYGFHTVADPGIFKCPIDGCGNTDPEPVVPNVSAFAIALAGPRLYYTDIEAGIVASVPK